MTIGEVQKVLQNLLREGVPIRNTSVILEALGDQAGVTRDPNMLTEYARSALARVISRQYRGSGGEIVVATVDPEIEEGIARLMEASPDTGMLGPDRNFSQTVVSQVAQMAEKMAAGGHQPIVLTRPGVRVYLKRIIERVLPNVVVLSYSEISDDEKVRSVGMVSLGED